MHILRLLMVVCLALGFVSYAVGDDAMLTKGQYSIRRGSAGSNLVEKIDSRAMLSRHLEGFEVQRKKTKDAQKHRLVFYNPTKKDKVEVTIIILSSVCDAEETVLEFLNNASGVYKPGSPEEKAIGDANWHLRTGQAKPITITFVRKNVLVSVFSDNPNTAESVARAIDSDIETGKEENVIHRKK